MILGRRLPLLLLFYNVVMTTGQSCVKKSVNGGWESYGNCPTQKDLESVLSQIKLAAEKDKDIERVKSESSKCQGKTLRRIPVTFSNGTTSNRYASMTEGWTVIQRREYGSVNFTRNWVEYVEGFGHPCEEYWLGLQAIRQLTKNGDHELRIDIIENETGNHYYAEYSSFRLEDESLQYTLRVSGYSGNATSSLADARVNSLGFANNQEFSTFDVDNDVANTEPTHCAPKHSSGWWYRGNSLTNLNGRFGAPPKDGIFWQNRNRMEYMPLIFSEMKIRRRIEFGPSCRPATCDGVTLKEIEIPTENGPAMKRNVSMDGNWTIIQRRIDGCVSFIKTWVEYRAGFGSPCRNFWLGLEAIHQLTKNGDHELRIDMIEKGTENRYYAEYSSFRLKDESAQYTLRATGYSGNATDSLTDITVRGFGVSNNQKFSSIDVDNDATGLGHCASQHSSGWWYQRCSITNLNGQFGAPIHNGIFWHDNNRRRYIMLIFSEMKIRKKN